MQLEKLDSNSLHLEAVRASENYHRSESYLLEVLCLVEDRKFHLECGVGSIYKYCVRLLGLSKAVSYALIAVIRKSKEVPELKLAVQSGKVTLSKAKKICSVVTPENHKEWLDLARYETSRVIEKCVAAANPREAIRESAVYKTGDRLEFKLGVSEEWLNALTEVKDLLSQKESTAVTSEAALLKLMRDFIEKHDPIKKAERARRRAKKESEQFPGTVVMPAIRNERKPIQRLPLKRKTIARAILNAVTLRDQNRCTFKANQARSGYLGFSENYMQCDQKRWLDVHHILPIAEGGTNEFQNLTTLCRAHHQMIHRIGTV